MIVIHQKHKAYFGIDGKGLNSAVLVAKSIIHLSLQPQRSRGKDSKTGRKNLKQKWMDRQEPSQRTSRNRYCFWTWGQCWIPTVRPRGGAANLQLGMLLLDISGI